ncbi:unnamed protein product [Didymodactylos carnosus]|uniref:DNA 3'-5' helicase n=1 Tax=Didymodactylos carnosus TaxID=1234261 RepID=A0A8S2CWA3_9BILA|nr:unnamed protein product [Didymodactylos carnosus]CAF3563720.1 unnamed protein product [Didymodactylos carnosus]
MCVRHSVYSPETFFTPFTGLYKVSAIEATCVVHGVKHAHSYLSQDLTVIEYVNKRLFPMSKVRKKILPTSECNQLSTDALRYPASNSRSTINAFDLKQKTSNTKNRRHTFPQKHINDSRPNDNNISQVSVSSVVMLAANDEDDDFIIQKQRPSQQPAKRKSKISTITKPKRKKKFLFEDVVPVQSWSSYNDDFCDPYGLVGGASVNRNQPNWLNLPAEIYQQIFSYIPVKQLLTQVQCVCQAWKQIVNDGNFLCWAKIFLRYEHKEKTALTKIERLYSMNNANHDNILEIILNEGAKIIEPINEDPCTIRFKFKHFVLEQLNEKLKKHSMYDYAIDLLSKNKDNKYEIKCFTSKFFNPVCTTIAICILAENVNSVRELLRLWFCSMSTTNMKYETIIDLFYYLLTLFTGARRLHDVVQFRYPYMLYYCLKEMEDSVLNQFNSIAQYILNMYHSLSDQPNILSTLQLTEQQETILCHNLEYNETIKIHAFAGTGKTTTLIAYAARRMDENFLYIAYNKAIQTHAETIFPSNVKCQTVHSLAFAKFGRQYKDCLGSLRIKSIVDVIHNRKLVGEKGRPINNLFTRARFVFSTLNTYIASDDHSITDEHVDQRTSNTANQTASQLVLTVEEKRNIASDADFVWSIMKNAQDNRVLMTHDGYLKLYQLSKPKILTFDCIFVDEAQDLTPAVIDIINNQRVSKILVGDRHQQIYAFRGAVDAMSKMESTVTFYLTKSFRFGYEIAFVSNLLLQKFCNETKYLVGNDHSCFIDGRSSSLTHGQQQQSKQKAYLFRTNFALFNFAVKLIFEMNISNVGFVGGFDSYAFDRILDIYFLWLDPEERRRRAYQIKDPQLVNFQSFRLLEKFSQDVGDVDLLGKIKIVQQHSHTILDKINCIRERHCQDSRLASILLSTAHKAKGLEFPIVLLADDFIPRPQDVPFDQVNMDEHRENLNILYVAATRAKNELILNQDLFYFLYKMCKEPIYDLTFESIDHKCKNCSPLLQTTITTSTTIDTNEKKLLFKFKPVQLSFTLSTPSSSVPTLQCIHHLHELFSCVSYLYHH